MTFEKKRIRLETLGEYLKEVRESLGFAVEKVADKTGISPKFITALEEGNYRQLPADIYMTGFLKKIAAFYSVDGRELVSQYKKERGIQQQLGSQAAGGGYLKKKILGRMVVTPVTVSIALGLLFAAVTMGYIAWQVMSINRTPSLEIFQPQDRQVVKDSFVNVRGKTDPGTGIAINNQSIFVDSEGNFKTQLGITAGQKDLVITAKNKFDKSVSKTISIIGESTAGTAEGDLDLKLEFIGDATASFAIDGGQSQAAVFHSGDTKTLKAAQKIVLSTTDAGVTKVTLNGQPLGVLGRPGESISDIPFFSESGNIK
ncbi:MAG: DUF4115 domain-containing protein [Patescibacteria group bacterium]|nr:DUF4115 domain-containing protein [Patescibacteria group bacterium]